MTKKEVKLSTGKTYRMTPKGLEVVYEDGSVAAAWVTPNDIRSLYYLVDEGKSIREAKRYGFEEGMSHAARLLMDRGFMKPSDFLLATGSWTTMAKERYPDPVKYREIKISGLRYRCRDGVIECHTPTGWEHAGEKVEYIKALADLIDNPVEEGSVNG